MSSKKKAKKTKMANKAKGVILMKDESKILIGVVAGMLVGTVFYMLGGAAHAAGVPAVTAEIAGALGLIGGFAKVMVE